MAVTKRLRFEILRRDNHTCRYCGASAPEVKLTVDHVTPVALGGNDDPCNLVTACVDCNSGKSATPADAALLADVAGSSVAYAAHFNRALELWRKRQSEMAAAVNHFDHSWRGWLNSPDDPTSYMPRDPDWEDSVERWITLGLTPTDLADLIPAAMRKQSVPNGQVWKYYCGVVWGHLREVSAAAAEELNG